MTARWVVDEVRPHRELHVNWQPISLFFKNEPDPESDGYPRYFFTHRLLRVMEAVRDEHGNDGVEAIYWEYGRRIHHDQDKNAFDIGDALAAVGFDRSLAAAADDEGRDPEIRRRMDIGLELAGDDIGTPIIACADCYGESPGVLRSGDHPGPVHRGLAQDVGRAAGDDGRAGLLGAQADPHRTPRVRRPPLTSGVAVTSGAWHRV